jgi:putative transposase
LDGAWELREQALTAADECWRGPAGWIKTARAECLDWLLIVGRGHLERVLRVYVDHYNRHRPHRALGLQPPDPAVGLTLTGKGQPDRISRRDLLGGLVHEYRQAA